ncbi:hypothetical protein GCM10027421_04810 [Microbacterium shaanxiense]
MFIYLGTASGGMTDATQLGIGWNGFTLIGGGDYTGDGAADLMGRRLSDQTIWLYRGNRVGDFSGGTQVRISLGRHVLIV